jgi:hypothetical protein
MDNGAAEKIRRFEKLKGDRSTWNNHWQELRELVRPSAEDFSRVSSKAERRHNAILDGTALLSSEQLAAGLHSFLTGPVERWFNLQSSDPGIVEDEESLAWLDQVSGIIYEAYSSPKSRFHSSIHEAYLDLAVFGTAVLYQAEDPITGSPTFRTFPLAQCYILENSEGVVDTLYRELKYTTRQAYQRFGEKTPEKIKKEKNPDKEWTFFHAVYPRKDYNEKKLDKTNMPYESCYVCVDLKEVVEEGGFKQFPYHAPRWSKLASEVYGRSPAMSCLPDIKMLNKMSEVVLKAAQKIIDPPLMVPDDGFLMPIQTAPSSLIFYTPGSDKIEPLVTNGRVDIGLDMMEQRREHITKSFYVDFLRMQKQKVEMTAYEVADRREEQLRMMAPMLGRLQTELLGPLIQRSYQILNDSKNLPPAPQQMQMSKMKIQYVSPAARAQVASRATSIQRFLGDIQPLAQISPDILDSINPDRLATFMAEVRDIPRLILRTSDEIAEIRKGRAEQQQQMQAAQMAEQAGKAAKSFSDSGLLKQLGVGGGRGAA